MSSKRVFTMAAAGHATSAGCKMYEEERPEGDASPSNLLKPLDPSELHIYQLLSNTFADDAVSSFVPRFHGVQEENEQARFLRLSNLLSGFSEPKVMDVKLGLRTFLHSEANNRPRADLFDKMAVDFPSALTPDELEARKVTKTKYMSLRDAQSTSGSLGFRVSGTAGCYGGPGATSKYRSSVSETEDAVHHAFRVFAKSASDGLDEQGNNAAQMAEKLVQELQRMRSAFEASVFVKKHECIGTSALLVLDAATGQCQVFWIDFGKTRACKLEHGLNHRAELSASSQEDGLLVGMDNLIAAWESVAQSLKSEIVSNEPKAANCCKAILAGRKLYTNAIFECVQTWMKSHTLGSPLKTMKEEPLK